MKTKYIIVELCSNGLVHEVAVCFPEYITHADMARAMRKTQDEVISAGFFSVKANAQGKVVVDVYGDSIGLRKTVRMGDAKIIERSIREY